VLDLAMTWSLDSDSLDFATLKALYASNSLKPSDVIGAVYRRMDRVDHVWISRVQTARALARAAELERDGCGLPSDHSHRLDLRNTSQ
jgi:hypothetical protein